jgi:hypothetical protein
VQWELELEENWDFSKNCYSAWRGDLGAAELGKARDIWHVISKLGIMEVENPTPKHNRLFFKLQSWFRLFCALSQFSLLGFLCKLCT